MSELILKGTDLFMKKTGSADKLHICGNAERMLFLIIGILLVFAGAKVYRLIVSFIMFWGVTIALCTLLFQIVLFERKSERGRKIWKRFFVKKSNI